MNVAMLWASLFRIVSFRTYYDDMSGGNFQRTCEQYLAFAVLDSVFISLSNSLRMGILKWSARDAPLCSLFGGHMTEKDRTYM